MIKILNQEFKSDIIGSKDKFKILKSLTTEVSSSSIDKINFTTKEGKESYLKISRYFVRLNSSKTLINFYTYDNVNNIAYSMQSIRPKQGKVIEYVENLEVLIFSSFIYDVLQACGAVDFESSFEDVKVIKSINYKNKGKRVVANEKKAKILTISEKVADLAAKSVDVEETEIESK